MNHPYFKFALWICITLITSSCTRLSAWNDVIRADQIGKEISCEALLPANLSRYPLGELDIEEAQLWIENAYGVKPQVETFNWGPDEYEQYLDQEALITWPYESGDFSVAFYSNGGGKIQNATSISFGQPRHFMLEALVRCWGEPEYYEAYYEQWPEARWTYLVLWYPELGCSVSGVRQRPVRFIDKTFPLWSITCTEPTSFRDVVREINTLVELEPSDPALERIRPWPDSLRSVVIDEPFEYGRN